MRQPHRADADRETDIPHLRLDEVSEVGQQPNIVQQLLWLIIGIDYSVVLVSPSSLHFRFFVVVILLLQIQFVWLLLYGTDHICLDKTGHRHVAPHRY